MVKYEKKKNIIGGIIMYSLMLLTYLISSISYISTIAKGYATSYTWAYFIEDLFLILAVIAAFVIMLIRKRQSGFGVTAPMLASLLSTIVFLIAIAIQNASSYYTAHPNWTTYLSFLLIIPITLVIIFFFVPNKALQIISAVTVGIALLTDMTSSIVEMIRAIGHHYFSGPYAFSIIFGLPKSLALYALIIVQIFVSFKIVSSVASQAYTPAPVRQRVVPKEEVLKNYQNLLENNLITPEQYEEKRKEIFGEQ